MMNREAYEGVTDLGDFETVMYGIEPDNTTSSQLASIHSLR